MINVTNTKVLRKNLMPSSELVKTLKDNDEEWYINRVGKALYGFGMKNELKKCLVLSNDNDDNNYIIARHLNMAHLNILQECRLDDFVIPIKSYKKKQPISNIFLPDGFEWRFVLKRQNINFESFTVFHLPSGQVREYSLEDYMQLIEGLENKESLHDLEFRYGELETHLEMTKLRNKMKDDSFK